MQRERGLTTKLVVDFDIRMQKVPHAKECAAWIFLQLTWGAEKWAGGKSGKRQRCCMPLQR